MLRLLVNYALFVALVYFVCLHVPAMNLQHALGVFRWHVAPADPDEDDSDDDSASTLLSARSIAVAAIETRYQQLAQLHAARNDWKALDELNRARAVLMDGRKMRQRERQQRQQRQQ